MKKARPRQQEASYFLYIIRTQSGTLYTGITTDLMRRWKEHSSLKTGSKYLKSVRPLEIAAAWQLQINPSQPVISLRSIASKLESKLKRLSREEKLRLIQRPSSIKRFDECQSCLCKSIHAARRRSIARSQQ